MSYEPRAMSIFCSRLAACLYLHNALGIGAASFWRRIGSEGDKRYSGKPDGGAGTHKIKDYKSTRQKDYKLFLN